MRERWEYFGISVTLTMCLLAISWLWHQSKFPEVIVTQQYSRVAGVNTAKFQESPNLPSPNQILSLVNAERQKAQLSPLQVNPKLEEIAQSRAEDMQKNNYYAHLAKNGKYYYDLMKENGLSTGYSCENLNLSFLTQPRQYVKDWLDSPSHKKCLMHNDASQAGYAIAKLALPSSNGSDNYLIVAIHTSDLTE